MPRGNTATNLLGQRFTRLLVVDRAENKGKRVHWNCVCDCGKKVLVFSGNLMNARTKSCGCFRSDSNVKRNKNNALPEGTAAVNCLFYKYEQNAVRRGYCFEISKALFKSLIKSNCFYCGASPSNRLSHKAYKGYIYNGIDRVDNSIGYVSDNVVACCFECNVFKKDASIDWILNAADKIRKFIDEKNR